MEGPAANTGNEAEASSWRNDPDSPLTTATLSAGDGRLVVYAARDVLEAAGGPKRAQMTFLGTTQHFCLQKSDLERSSLGVPQGSLSRPIIVFKFSLRKISNENIIIYFYPSIIEGFNNTTFC